jgi:hypothetical protein
MPSFTARTESPSKVSKKPARVVVFVALFDRDATLFATRDILRGAPRDTCGVAAVVIAVVDVIVCARAEL